MMKKVSDVIENEINPQLKLHGGGCKVVKVESGIVTIELSGGCAGCPGRQMTLLNSIAPVLKAKVPGIKNVVLS